MTVVVPTVARCAGSKSAERSLDAQADEPFTFDTSTRVGGADGLGEVSTCSWWRSFAWSDASPSTSLGTHATRYRQRSVSCEIEKSGEVAAVGLL